MRELISLSVRVLLAVDKMGNGSSDISATNMWPLQWDSVCFL